MVYLSIFFKAETEMYRPDYNISVRSCFLLIYSPLTIMSYIHSLRRIFGAKIVLYQTPSLPYTYTSQPRVSLGESDDS